MSLFGEEFRKMWNRRIVWTGIAVLTAFLFFYIYGDTGSRMTVVEGTRYWGLEAVQADRKAAKEWEGVLTMEKLDRILDTYGVAVEEIPGNMDTRSGNWVSRYATNLLTDVPQGGTGEPIGEEKREQIRDRLDRYQPHFAYLDGISSLLLEGGMMADFGILFLVILAAAPVFAEEYSLKTAGLLLTTAEGRKKDVRMKIWAAFLGAAILYGLVHGALFGVYLTVYGGAGLKAGACLLNNILGYETVSVGRVWLINLGWGLLGVWMMTGAALLFSAKCQTPFQALIWSLVFLASGYVIVQAAPILISYKTVYRIAMSAGLWSPFYLSSSYGIGQPVSPLIKGGYVAAVTAGCVWGGRQIYRKKEV